MKQHRILVATDIPFWRKSTGAQMRISSLVDYFSAEPFVVRTFYLGQTNSPQFTENDRQQIADQQLDIEQQSSDQMPKSWPGRLGWYANQFRPKLSGDSSKDETACDGNSPEPPASLQLEDFRWPWAAQAFCDSIAGFQPDSILIEYVKLSYLIDGLTAQQRNSIHCVIDTHDALHVRCEKFKQRGFKHWLEINRDEEARELDKFDTVVAIQTEEATLFKQMAPHAKTIVCGYIPQTSASTPNPDTEPGGAGTSKNPSETFSIGYLGSTNDSNAQAIEKFLDTVWKPLKQKLSADKSNGESKGAPAIQLVIGGSICQFVAKKLSTCTAADTNVRLLGHVEDVSDFYQSVDVVINPAEFGTGLKIKSVEGLAFAKPLLSTPEGVVGLEQHFRSPDQPHAEAIIVCQTIDQFLPELERLARNPAQLSALKCAAKMLAKSAYSLQHPYSTLKQLLLQGK